MREKTKPKFKDTLSQVTFAVISSRSLLVLLKPETANSDFVTMKPPKKKGKMRAELVASPQKSSASSSA